MRLVGIDIGGTFTDLALYDSETESVKIHKVRSTPHDPGVALVNGLVELCDRSGVDPKTLDGVLHGTTVATNAVLEHNGAKTGVITSEGVRDVLHIGRHQRPEPYSLLLEIPWQNKPFAERECRLTVPERLAADGSVITPLDERAVRDAAQQLAAMDVESVAICFLFSYLDQTHELRAAEIVREEMPNAFVCTSADIATQFREFERFTTASMNAFVGPGTGDYLARLRAGLDENGIDSEILIMRSNGGVASVAEAAERPVSLMLSGPAAGILGASWASGLIGRKNLVTFDLGGTSADIAIVTEDGVSEASARDTSIAGFPLLTPMFDIQTIGAGGGSIAYVDEAGAFRVGPRSAGAVPGPACYGFGGERPTITDAHMVLGRLDADRFLGGEMTLQPERSTQVVGQLAEQLGVTLEEAADGILTLANANMAQTIRSITVERGHDPRQFSLVAFGGAGPLHSAELAEALGINEVIVPPHPGITSAAGLLTSDLRYDHMKTVFQVEGSIDNAAIIGGFAELAELLVARLVRDGADAEAIDVDRYLDCRYVGQGYELRVPVGADGGVTQEVLDAFHAAHREEYGHSFSDPIEIVNLRVIARGHRPKLERVVREPVAAVVSDEVPLATWKVDGALVELPTPHIDRDALPVGEGTKGPMILLQHDTTVVVPPSWVATPTPEGVVLLTNEGSR